MHISAQTIDDLMYHVLTELLQRPSDVISSRSSGESGLGPSSEIIGAMLTLKDPRQRLSRDEAKGTVFSALGELLWYLSQSNDLNFIAYYIDRYLKETEDGETVYGGYGPRLFNMRGIDQIENVINLLKAKPTSRKAVIQLINAEDLVGRHPEIPCTCTLQFLIRNNRLHMFTTMRSNDAFRGLPHDIFAFTMLQEILARTLNADLGEYHHAVGSLHLYDKDISKANDYINIGFHSTKFPMPEMPIGNPWSEINILLKIENEYRNGTEIHPNILKQLNPYWADFVYLLYAFSISYKEKVFKSVSEINDCISKTKNLNNQLSNKSYEIYINRRITILENKLSTATL